MEWRMRSMDTTTTRFRGRFPVRFVARTRHRRHGTGQNTRLSGTTHHQREKRKEKKKGNPSFPPTRTCTTGPPAHSREARLLRRDVRVRGIKATNSLAPTKVGWQNEFRSKGRRPKDRSATALQNHARSQDRKTRSDSGESRRSCGLFSVRVRAVVWWFLELAMEHTREGLFSFFSGLEFSAVMEFSTGWLFWLG